MYKVSYIADYYDQPIEGFAQSGKGDVYFFCRFSQEKDDYEDIFLVYLINDLNFGEIGRNKSQAELSELMASVKEKIGQGHMQQYRARPKFFSTKRGVKGDFCVDWAWEA